MLFIIELNISPLNDNTFICKKRTPISGITYNFFN